MTRRKHMLADLEQDIRDHLERETQDNIDRGMSPEDARSAAMRKFGNVARVKEETWEVWRSCGLSNCFRMFASAFARCCEARAFPSLHSWQSRWASESTSGFSRF